MIGFLEALNSVLDHVNPIGSTAVPIPRCVGMIAARDVLASVDSPSTDIALKDGYALRSKDTAKADHPVLLPVVDMAAAGSNKRLRLYPKCAIRILTGAQIPVGADAVVPEEDVVLSDKMIRLSAAVQPGQSILPKGGDILRKTALVGAGTILTPGLIGYLAAGGVDEATVHQSLKVTLVATGDEIRLPGQSLKPGQLFASNLMTLDAWCRHFGIKTDIHVVPDDESRLKACVAEALEKSHVVVTSGGAWSGDRDLTVKVLEDLGWRKQFHRVRLGPGKAVGFGVAAGIPVFVLPGGPPSNLVAFLTLALPGLMKMAGHTTPGLPKVSALVDTPVCGQLSWTQAFFGHLTNRSWGGRFAVGNHLSRFSQMASANGLLLLPEGENGFEQGQQVDVLVLKFPDNASSSPEPLK